MIDTRQQEQALLAQCVAGDKTAATDFVRCFSDLVFRSIQYVLRQKQVPYQSQDLEDLHHTVFVSLFDNDRRKLRQYQGKNNCSVRTWLNIIIVRVVLDELRKKHPGSLHHGLRQVALDEVYHLDGNEPPVWAAYERVEMQQSLDRAIGSLPSRDQLFLRLHLRQELSMDELAEVMQITVQNAYTMKHRVIRKLRDRIGAHDGR